MSRVSHWLLILTLIFCCPLFAQKVFPDPAYAIIVSCDFPGSTADADDWKFVRDELKKKYQARVFSHQGLPDADVSLKRGLSAFHPQYVCFLVLPEHCSKDFVKSACRFMRSLDDDPYDDALWSILTGYSSNDALRIIRADRLSVRRELSHMGNGWMSWLESGVSFNEGKKGSKWIKQPGDVLLSVKGPDDTTAEWVACLNHNNCDLILTSGHASEYDWSMGYSYRAGKIRTLGHDGGLIGEALDGKTHEIRTDNPKIYFGPGNCLIANIPPGTRECMALCWIHHGVNLFFGHIESQTRVCTAWGIWSYFAALQGQFMFAEAVHANRISSRYLSEKYLDEKQRKEYERCLNKTVLYGDPAWDARIKKTRPPLYELSLSMVERDSSCGLILLDLEFNQDLKFDIRYNKPPVFLLPFRIADWAVVSSDFADLLISDDFILADTMDRVYKKGDVLRATIRFSFQQSIH